MVREGLAHPYRRRDDRVALIVPAYNEERFIGSVVLKARQQVGKVIVVDDGSSDATASIAAAAGAVVVSHERNQGKGAALNTGFRKARELDVEAVVLLDGDGQHLPEETISVLQPVMTGEADIVVGSRYLQRNNTPSHRVVGHSLMTGLTNLTSGIRLSDSQSGFRAFSRRAIEAVCFSSAGFSVESEMQFLAKQYDLKVLEVPITIRYTDKPKRNVMIHGLMVLNGLLRLIGQHRPLLFFGVFGLVTALLGIFGGVWVIDIYRHSRTLATGYALISVALLLVGTFALFTGLILHSLRGFIVDLLRPATQRSHQIAEREASSAGLSESALEGRVADLLARQGVIERRAPEHEDPFDRRMPTEIDAARVERRVEGLAEGHLVTTASPTEPVPSPGSRSFAETRWLRERHSNDSVVWITPREL